MEMDGMEPQVVYCGQHDWEGEQNLSMAVVEAVASVADEEVVDLPPLYEFIDTDALDNLFTPRLKYGRPDGTISFEFAGYLVTVRSTGELLVYES